MLPTDILKSIWDDNFLKNRCSRLKNAKMKQRNSNIRNIFQENKKWVVQIQGHNRKKTSVQIAKELSLTSSSVRNIISIFKKRGNAETNFKTKKTQVTARDCRRLKKIVTTNRRETAAGVNALWMETINKKLSTDTCKRTFKNMGYGFYKVTKKTYHTNIK